MSLDPSLIISTKVRSRQAVTYVSFAPEGTRSAHQYKGAFTDYRI